jgi:hypothetical protein
LETSSRMTSTIGADLLSCSINVFNFFFCRRMACMFVRFVRSWGTESKTPRAENDFNYLAEKHKRFIERWLWRRSFLGEGETDPVFPLIRGL